MNQYQKIPPKTVLLKLHLDIFTGDDNYFSIKAQVRDGNEVRTEELWRSRAFQDHADLDQHEIYSACNHYGLDLENDDLPFWQWEAVRQIKRLPQLDQVNRWQRLERCLTIIEGLCLTEDQNLADLAYLVAHAGLGFCPHSQWLREAENIEEKLKLDRVVDWERNRLKGKK